MGADGWTPPTFDVMHQPNPDEPPVVYLADVERTLGTDKLGVITVRSIRAGTPATLDLRRAEVRTDTGRRLAWLEGPR